jgi:hypothetical protein
MADEAATPSPGAEQAAAPTDEASALQRIQSVLEPQRPPETPKPAPAEATPVEEPEEDDTEREPAVEGDEADEASTETEASEDEPEAAKELPKTLRALADHFGKDPAELAGSIEIEINGPEGKEVITLAEAIRGNLRESDYTRKTQAVAEKERALEADRTAAAAAFQQKFQHLEIAMATAQDLLGAGPSDADLYALADPNSPRYDPAGYVAAKADQDAKFAKLNALQQKHAEARQQQQIEAENNKIRVRTEQQRLLAQRMPEMRDQKSMRAFETAMVETLPKAYGFSEQNIQEFMAGPFDHKMVLVIRDALKYQALQAGKKELTKQVKAAPKKTVPGTPTNRSTPEVKIQSARSNLRKTGSKDAAIEFLRNVL